MARFVFEITVEGPRLYVKDNVDGSVQSFRMGIEDLIELRDKIPKVIDEINLQLLYLDE